MYRPLGAAAQGPWHNRVAMKPAPFRYARPATAAEAVALLAASPGDTKLLAGGQSLVPLLNFRLARPRHLVDINRIAALDQLYDVPGRLVQRDAHRFSPGHFDCMHVLREGPPSVLRVDRVGNGNSDARRHEMIVAPEAMWRRGFAPAIAPCRKKLIGW